MTVLDFQLFRLVGEDSEPAPNVVGDLLPRNADDGGVADRPVLEHGKVGRPAADVEKRNADLLLLLVEHGVARGNRLKDDVADGDAGEARRRDQR